MGTKLRAKKRDPLRSGLFAPGPRFVGGGHTVKMAKASPKPPEYTILTAPHIHRATDISLRGPPTEKKLSQRQLLKRAERRARQRLRQAVDARSIGLLVQYGEARGARGGSTQADSFVAPDDEWPSTTVTTMQLDSQVETHLSAEAQYAQGVLDGRVVVEADAGAATYGMQRPSDDPEDDRIRAELAEAKRKAALRLPRAPLAERDALLRKRVPPDVDLLVRARNKNSGGGACFIAVRGCKTDACCYRLPTARRGDTDYAAHHNQRRSFAAPTARPATTNAPTASTTGITMFAGKSHHELCFR